MLDSFSAILRMLKFVCGLKLRRQAPIGPYYVDFVCLKEAHPRDRRGSARCTSRFLDATVIPMVGERGIPLIGSGKYNEVL